MIGFPLIVTFLMSNNRLKELEGWFSMSTALEILSSRCHEDCRMSGKARGFLL